MTGLWSLYKIDHLYFIFTQKCFELFWVKKALHRRIVIEMPCSTDGFEKNYPKVL